jgi:plastocyanin
MRVMLAFAAINAWRGAPRRGIQMMFVRFAKRPALAALLVVAGLAIAGCGGGNSNGNSNGNSTGGQATSPLGNLASDRTPQPTAPAETVVIKVTDNAFDPATVTVKRGTIVRWEWEGTANPHSIQMQGTTSPQQTEGFFERKLDQPGVSIAYQCGVHGSAMSGRIMVQ